MDKPQTVRLTTKVPELEGTAYHFAYVMLPIGLTNQSYRGTTILQSYPNRGNRESF